ncbi:MAG TPA: hypothetical protein VLT47_07790 [Anaeromyxobacteraceae bacterium]|nr:hypothetical protein [Anaeromyxobacteraceae bacterium]
MTPQPGHALALLGIALFGLGVVVATGAGFVVFFRLRRPANDPVARTARRVLVGAGVMGAVGLAVFAWAAAR